MDGRLVVLAGLLIGAFALPAAPAGAAAFSVSCPSITEGSSGTTSGTVTVSLDAAVPGGASVHIASVDGTATLADNDYVQLPDTLLNFGPMETTKTVQVSVKGDTDGEPTGDLFWVVLSNATGATATGNTRHCLTAVANDDPVDLSIAPASLTEGNAGDATMPFTVSLSRPSEDEITVDYATSDSSAGAADYGATSGTLTFAVGETSKTISVPVHGDAVDEPDETLTVTLSNAASAGDFSAAHTTFLIVPGILLPLPAPVTGTIADDDEPPPVTPPVTQPPVTPPVTPPPVTPKPPDPPLPKASEAIKLPENKKCVSRNVVTIRFVRPAGSAAVRKIQVFRDGKSVKVVNGFVKSASVDLRKLPTKKFTFKAVVTYASGKQLSSTRTYTPCSKKKTKPKKT